MTVLAVIGDCTTTTCIALAAGWSSVDDVIVLEADASGGSLTGWLDTPSTPSLATIVANRAGQHTTTGEAITAMVQHSASGIRFIAAPVRATTAFRAIEEAAGDVIPWLAASESIVLADIGRHRGGSRLPATLTAATAVVVVHRQDPASAAASTVRLERVVEVVQQVATLGLPIVLAIIGAEPFDPHDVTRFVEESAPAAVASSLTLADDPLSAAVIAGRPGVSAKRLRRLPLMRTASHATTVLRPFTATPVHPLDPQAHR